LRPDSGSDEVDDEPKTTTLEEDDSDDYAPANVFDVYGGADGRFVR
jgi:hypothetical protein